MCAIKYYTRIIHTFKKSQRVQYDGLGGVCNCRAMRARTRATKSHVWQRSYAFWQFGDSTCRQVVVQLASAADNNNCIYDTSLINHPAISAFSASDFWRYINFYVCMYVCPIQVIVWRYVNLHSVWSVMIRWLRVWRQSGTELSIGWVDPQGLDCVGSGPL